MSKIVLTGASGVLGTGFRKMFSSDDIINFEGDITDFKSFRTFLEGVGSHDALLHFAALVPRRIVDANPVLAFNVNSMGTLNVLEACRQLHASAGRPWIFYASTSHVYAPADRPLKETDELKPHSLYGLSKLHAEQLCESYAETHALPICTGRIFSFSDPLQSEDFFMPATFRRVLSLPREAKLEMPGLTSTRDFLRVPQVCRAIGVLMKNRAEGPINIGTGVGVPIRAMVDQIISVLNRSDIVVSPMEDPPLQLTADVQKLTAFGINLDSEVRLLIDEMAPYFLKK